MVIREYCIWFWLLFFLVDVVFVFLLFFWVDSLWFLLALAFTVCGFLLIFLSWQFVVFTGFKLCVQDPLNETVVCFFIVQQGWKSGGGILGNFEHYWYAGLVLFGCRFLFCLFWCLWAVFLDCLACFCSIAVAEILDWFGLNCSRLYLSSFIFLWCKAFVLFSLKILKGLPLLENDDIGYCKLLLVCTIVLFNICWLFML